MGKRVMYLSVEELWRLSHAVRPIEDAFGGKTVYLVGSVLERQDWRDVDLRMILNDAEFKDIFVPPCGTTDHISAPLYDQFRMLFQTSLTFMLRHQTGLPVDFQFQSHSESVQFDGKRNPVTNRPYVGHDFIPQWMRLPLDMSDKSD